MEPTLNLCESASRQPLCCQNLSWCTVAQKMQACHKRFNFSSKTASTSTYCIYILQTPTCEIIKTNFLCTQLKMFPSLHLGERLNRYFRWKFWRNQIIGCIIENITCRWNCVMSNRKKNFCRLFYCPLRPVEATWSSETRPRVKRRVSLSIRVLHSRLRSVPAVL